MEALWFYAVQELSGWGIYTYVCDVSSWASLMEALWFYAVQELCVCVCVCDFLVIWGGFYAVMLVIG